MIRQEYASSVNELKYAIINLFQDQSIISKSRISKLSVQVNGVSPLHWLSEQPPGGRIYWSGRDYGIEVAAIGEADCHYSSDATDLKKLRSQLKDRLAGCHQGIRYYGGIRFDLNAAHEEHWNRFGSWRFVLPRFELQNKSHSTTLHCNLVFPDDLHQLESIVEQLEGLGGYSHQPQEYHNSLGHSFRPEYEKWGRVVQCALKRFASTPLDKVVLAREAAIRVAESLSPISMIQYLKSINSNCFHFLFEPTSDEAFLGASPERLFRREGRSIESEAVAGTCPRGESDLDDARMIDELVRSAKEQREHEYVRMSLQEEISLLAAHVTMDTLPSIMRLASERHLVSRLRAIMKQEYTSLDVLEALHPTPAVGGYPSERALDFIRNHEPFDRGWYGGPIGWLGVNEAEFAVAIRSALVSGVVVRLYSGAGIVRGSTPLDEWNEVGHKIGDLEDFLKINTSSENPEFQDR
ncbi:MAG: isochorismate synthase [Bacteroidetes bacterium]|nr:isochorismate synthase [Bacteroidota bacterium]